MFLQPENELCTIADWLERSSRNADSTGSSLAQDNCCVRRTLCSPPTKFCRIGLLLSFERRAVHQIQLCCVVLFVIYLENTARPLYTEPIHRRQKRGKRRM